VRDFGLLHENPIKWQVTSGDSGAHRVDSVCD
jgi:hypothetical protein